MAVPREKPSSYWGTPISGNPAPVDRWFIPLFIGFQPSKVLQDFFHQEKREFRQQRLVAIGCVKSASQISHRNATAVRCKLRCKAKASIYILKGGPKAGCTKKFCTLHMTGFRHWSASVVGMSSWENIGLSVYLINSWEIVVKSHTSHIQKQAPSIPQHPKSIVLQILWSLWLKPSKKETKQTNAEKNLLEVITDVWTSAFYSDQPVGQGQYLNFFEQSRMVGDEQLEGLSISV